MRTVEVSLIAQAVANISAAMATANAATLMVVAGRQVIESTRRQALEQGIHIEVRTTDLESEVWEVIRPVALATLLAAERDLQNAGLGTTFGARLDRLKSSMAAKHSDARGVRVRLEELRHDLLDELGKPVFVEVEAGRRDLFEQTAPPFGVDVESVFADARDDISAAARCLALGQWTASVFHSMRVLEHGLRALAAKLSLPPDAVVLENWNTVIERIEKAIRDLQNQPKSLLKAETLEKYSKAAVQFRYFKDAWRNHVSHSRASYDEGAAQSVFNHTKQLMQHLATQP